MRVSISLPRDGTDDWATTIAYVQEAERLGVHSVWSAEAWGHDGITPLAFLAAHTSTIKLGTGILQGGTRTPALLAMTAMGMQSISGGRFLLGFGTSGPQVIEGFHGIPFTGAVSRIRETIEIVRKVISGERVTYQGRHYTLPLPGGEGKALRTSAAGLDHLPIYVASLGPNSLRMTGELADGWLGTSFVPETADVFLDPMRAARRRRDGPSATSISRPVEPWSSPTTSMRPRPATPAASPSRSARWARPTTNFYNDAFVRQGWADDAKAVQRLWVEGQRDEARARVPVELALKINCLGDDLAVRDRLRVYRDAGVTTFRAGVEGNIDERVETLGRVMALVEDLNAEDLNAQSEPPARRGAITTGADAGTGRGTRTLTTRRSADFKSAASASSAIPAGVSTIRAARFRSSAAEPPAPAPFRSPLSIALQWRGGQGVR